MFYCVGDWDDLQIDLHVSLHDGFKKQFAGIVPVFLEFNGYTLQEHGDRSTSGVREAACARTCTSEVPTLSGTSGIVLWCGYLLII